MNTTTISFEASEEVLHQLDGAASLQHRHRDAILRDALEQYLASDREFTAMVEEGLRQADAGELIEHREIEARIAGWVSGPIGSSDRAADPDKMDGAGLQSA